MKTVSISGEDEAVDGLMEMLTEQEAHTGDHIYEMHEVKVKEAQKLCLECLYDATLNTGDSIDIVSVEECETHKEE